MPSKSRVSVDINPEATSAQTTAGGKTSTETAPEKKATAGKRPRTPKAPRTRRAPRKVSLSTNQTGPQSKAPSIDRTLVPPIIVATADPSLGRMLSFALDQMRLQYRLLDSGSLTLRELLDMQVGSQRPLVVLDVDLPGVDGHAILERIGVDRPDTFLILVLSSHADESVQVRSLLAGALDHLSKPFNVRVLMAKIQRWVAISAHLSGAA